MISHDPSSLKTLFLDLNAYFASVEQQLRPELRGKPVAVAPVMSDSTCCIAASYEAKRYGIKTGTNVGDARRLCPELLVVEARPEIYVRFHHDIVKAVDTCLPVGGIHSIDEMSCRLGFGQREPQQAIDLARRVKRAIADHVGEYLRCSIGIAPNRFLAKVATKMQKPDGLVVIERHELPQRLFSLELRDLPGIGPRMHERLVHCGVHSVEQLCAMNEANLAGVWESVIGRLWWRLLRGEDVPEMMTHRRSVGHEHVLPPEARNDDAARAVIVRLIHKAAARLRNLRYWARKLTISVRHVDGQRWSVDASLGCTQDTLAMLHAFSRLWTRRLPTKPLKVGMVLHDLVSPQSATLPLFHAEQQRHNLAAIMDRINNRFGRHGIYAASMHEERHSAPVRIAFSSIPDLTLQA